MLFTSNWYIVMTYLNALASKSWYRVPKLIYNFDIHQPICILSRLYVKIPILCILCFLENLCLLCFVSVDFSYLYISSKVMSGLMHLAIIFYSEARIQGAGCSKRWSGQATNETVVCYQQSSKLIGFCNY